MNSIKIYLFLFFNLLAVFAMAAAPPPTPVPFDPVSALVLGAGGTLLARKYFRKEK